MKRYFFIAVLALIAAGSFAQGRNDREPYLTKSLSGSIKKVTVETSGGSISVAGASAEPRVEVYISQNNNGGDLSKEEIQKRLNEDYNMTISVDNNQVTAVAKAKTRNMNWKKALNISFRVYVPQNVSTELSTSGGSIELTSLAGDQRFSTSGGSLNLNKVSGDIKGRTSGGSIQVTDCKDDIDLQTSGGSIMANNCQGNLNLETSGGSLRLTALKGKIKAHTSGGNVQGEKISGELTAHTSGGNVDLEDLYCSLETSTSGGKISVSIRELGKYVTINNSGGNIDLELPANKGVDLRLVANKIRTTSLNNFNGKSDDDQVEGTLNGGGVPVKVLAGSGKIVLSFK